MSDICLKQSNMLKGPTTTTCTFRYILTLWMILLSFSINTVSSFTFVYNNPSLIVGNNNHGHLDFKRKHSMRKMHTLPAIHGNNKSLGRKDNDTKLKMATTSNLISSSMPLLATVSVSSAKVGGITGILSQTKTILAALANARSGMNAFLAFKEILLNTSPLVYFSCLILAGVGVPLSEDALCIFTGSILPSIWYDRPVFRTKLILALYFGVVLSDIITFSIGRFMGKGLFEPLSKKLDLRSSRIDFCEEEENDEENDTNEDEEDLSPEEIEKLQNEAGEDALCEIPTSDLKTKDSMLAILENVGDYAGFVIRFSIGMRLPMMLATGFSGKVPIGRFIVGTSIGALFSLSIQLTSGWLLSNNPAIILALLGAVSTFPLVIPSLFAFGSWLNLMYMRWSLYKKPKRMSS